jgi:hypothetical protein
MRVDRIAVGDIIKASIKGRVIYGEVREIIDGVVHFHPLSPAAGWRHATSRDITAHWHKTRRSSAGGHQEITPTRVPTEQISLPGFHP